MDQVKIETSTEDHIYEHLNTIEDIALKLIRMIHDHPTMTQKRKDNMLKRLYTLQKQGAYMSIEVSNHILGRK